MTELYELNQDDFFWQQDPDQEGQYVLYGRWLGCGCQVCIKGKDPNELLGIMLKEMHSNVGCPKCNYGRKFDKYHDEPHRANKVMKEASSTFTDDEWVAVINIGSKYAHDEVGYVKAIYNFLGNRQHGNT